MGANLGALHVCVCVSVSVCTLSVRYNNGRQPGLPTSLRPFFSLAAARKEKVEKRTQDLYLRRISFPWMARIVVHGPYLGSRSIRRSIIFSRNTHKQVSLWIEIRHKNARLFCAIQPCLEGLAKSSSSPNDGLDFLRTM